VGVVNDCYVYTAHAEKCDIHVTTVILYGHKYMTCGNKEGGHLTGYVHIVKGGNQHGQWLNY